MKKGFASDYITAKRQNAIYLNIQSNAEFTGNTTNPVKSNGYYYNNMLNVCVPGNCSVNDCSGGALTNARSYQLRLDFKKGKYYNHYVCNCNKTQINSVESTCNNEDCPTCEVMKVNGNTVSSTCLCSDCAFNSTF